jgi:cystine transport system substrate-binding protein
VLGQAHAPRRRLFGVAVAAAALLALPAVGGAEPPRSEASLEAEGAALASRERSAVLGLYALDSQLARGQARLAALERRANRLRREQVALAAEMKVALAGARVSQQRLASHIRLLFDHGRPSVLEVLFGATSLDQALTDLDNLQQVTAVNRDVLEQLQAAKARIASASRQLSKRASGVASAVREQEATLRALEGARAARTAYIADLRHRRDMNSLQIQRIQAQAHAAHVRTAKLVVAPQPPAAALPAPVFETTAGGRTLTVSATAYSLPGHTASGLPVGWGIVAVDPSVIPLGTRMTIPGYGEAVAADTGSAVKGAIIDIWFPTLEMAMAWGRRSITITVH